MEITEHYNWIAGRWIPARSELTFEVRGAADDLGRWPRSGAADLELALDSLTRGDADQWSRASRRERFELLLRASAELTADTTLATRLASSTGLGIDEARSALDADLFQLAEGLEFWRDASPVDAQPRPGVFAAHWSDLAGRLGARLARRLLDGDPVVLLGDARVPAMAEALVQALERAGLPPGVLSLLWDDRSTVMHAALAHPDVHWIRAAGPHEGLRALCERAPPRLVERGALWPLKNRSLPLAEAHVPAEAAARVVEQAIGRAATLSGQFPGQVARVVCPERAFSRFTGALLEALAAVAEAERPLAPLDADLGEHVGAAWALGLDEGATPVHGTEPARSGPQPVVVFTNVDPDLSLARLSRPAPVLALIRARSDEHARELALDLDRPVPLIPCESGPR